MIKLCANVTSSGPRDDLELLTDGAELVVRSNVRWIHAQRRLGREPPCCAACGGVRYVPPTRAEYMSASIQFLGAAELLKAGRGACGSIAAYDAAICRANGKTAYVVIQPPQAGRYYHAVVAVDGHIEDPTADMVQSKQGGCATCSGAK